MQGLIKKIQIVTIVLFGAIVVMSCNKTQDQEYYQTEDIPEFPTEQRTGSEQDTTSNKAVIDSVKAINAKTDSLQTAQSQFNDRLQSCENQIKDVNRSSALYILMALCVGGVTALISIVAIFKCVRIKDSLKRHRAEIEKIKLGLSNLQINFQHGYNQITPHRGTTSDEYYTLSRRIQALEQKLLISTQPAMPSHATVIADKTETDNRTSYFGTPSHAQGDSAYFKKEFTHRDSDVMFVASISGEIAEFKPIEDGGTARLGTLTSSEPMKLAVEFIGCAPSEANSMRVESPGTVEFDGERWYIKDKTKVRLMK
jgi:hypothetical protein